MKVLYLTWGETPRSYGVFGSQVLGQFVENSKEIPDGQFYFASALPIIHSGLVREKWSYSAEIKKVKEKLGEIPFFLIPIYAPQNIINSSKSTFRWMHFGTRLHLKKLLQRISPDIIHCRSYHAAWAALNVKRKYGFGYKIIFDARGLWPEEVALKKKYSFESKDYQFLKSIESKILNSSDITVAVSDPMRRHFELLNAKKVETIYLSADIEHLAYNSCEIKNDRVQFCYVGALNNNTWHKPEVLLDLFFHIRSLIGDAQLTIVTTSCHDSLKKIFSKYIDDVFFLSTKNVEELGEIFGRMDFGVMSYFKPTTDREIMLSRMVLAVKTAEYLISGLPMIVNNACGGASAIVEENEMGIVYDPDDFHGLTLEKIDRFLFNEEKIRISNKAKCLFGYKKHAELYALSYRSLIRNE